MMRIFQLGAACVFTLALLTPAQAQVSTFSEKFYDMGQQVCRGVLFEGLNGEIGDYDYITYLKAAELDAEDYCDCVGKQFADNAESQSDELTEEGADETAAFLSVAARNLDACLPPFTTLSMEAQQQILGSDEWWNEEDPTDGDLVEGEQDGIDWAARPHFSNCVLASEGVLDVEQFDTEALDEWFEGSGLGAEDLCECVNVQMEDRIEDGLLVFTGPTTDDYWTQMFSSVADCSYAMWNGRQ